MDQPTVIAVAFAALAGAVFGLAADRLAARWPAHEPETAPPRRVDWRTVVVTLAGAGTAAGLVLRWSDPRDLAILVTYAAALVVLLATDLDQRLLPDLLTLPMIAFAGALLLVGGSPLLAGRELGVVSAIAAGIGAPIVLLATDRLLHGELGAGDLKLAVSIGLLCGVARFFSGFLVASVGFALVLLVLLATRRLGLRSAVPFGPVLIGAAFVAMLVP